MADKFLQDIHDDIKELYKVGLVTDEEMKHFDTLCLPETPAYTPERIKGLRAKVDMTQNAFARLLNVSISTVQKREIGQKKPAGAARKLLSVLENKGLSALL